MSTKKENLILDALRCGRVQPLDSRSERRPPVGTLVYQTEPGKYLRHVRIFSLSKFMEPA